MAPSGGPTKAEDCGSGVPLLVQAARYAAKAAEGRRREPIRKALFICSLPGELDYFLLTARRAASDVPRVCRWKARHASARLQDEERCGKSALVLATPPRAGREPLLSSGP